MSNHLQTPVIPVRFVESTFCTEGENVLFQYLRKQGTPQDILDLCQVVFWSFHYTTDAFKNNGMVGEDVNCDAQELTIKGLQILDKLELDF